MISQEGISIPVQYVPDVKLINEFLAQLKTSMGAAGKDIKLIDDTTFRKAAEAAKQSGTAIAGLNTQLEQTSKKAETAGVMFNRAFQFSTMTTAVGQFTQAIDQLAQPFIKFEASLADMSAITGVSGEGLKMFGSLAKDLAGQFGGTAVDQIEAFKGVLSRLGPDIAKSPEALEKMALSINTISKASGMDATKSMDALTTSMLQFNVSLDDPVQAADTMTSMMNVLAAGAKEGAAEIPQVSEAIKAAGVAASGAKMSFEETNAAIQVLATGGKVGAEAGTALRNVLGMLQNASGPAEQAMKAVGTSSKELGTILTTQGLGPAIARLKAGFDTLGTAQEKNSALMEIFGTENAAAAGILLNRADMIGDLTTKLTGTQTAFDQAQTNMDTTSAALDRYKAVMSNTLTTMFSGLGSGVTMLSSGLQQTLPIITTFSGLKNLFPGAGQGVQALATSLVKTLVPSLVVTTTASGVTTAGFGAMAAAVWAALAPMLPFIAVAGALGVGIYALAGGFDKSTESKIKDAEATEKSIQSQIKQKESQIQMIDNNAKLARSWEELGQKANKSPEELKRFNDLQLDLIKAYPGVIDGHKSFGDNLVALKAKLSDVQTKVREYKSDLDKLQERKEQIITFKLQLNATKAVGDAQVAVKDALQGFTASMQDIQEGEVLKGMMYNINNAKNSEELARGLEDINAKIFASQNISDEDKVKLSDAAEAVSKARSATLDRYAKLDAAKTKKNNEALLNEIANYRDKIDSGQIKQSAAETEAAVLAIAKKYGKTKEEAEALFKEQEKNTAEARKTAAAAANIADSYVNASKKAKEAFDAGKGKENEIKYKIKMEDDPEKKKVLQQQLKDVKAQNKLLDKENDDLIKLNNDTNKEYEDKKKAGKSDTQKFIEEMDKQGLKTTADMNKQQLQMYIDGLKDQQEALSQNDSMNAVEKLRREKDLQLKIAEFENALAQKGIQDQLDIEIKGLEQKHQEVKGRNAKTQEALDKQTEQLRSQADQQGLAKQLDYEGKIQKIKFDSGKKIADASLKQRLDDLKVQEQTLSGATMDNINQKLTLNRQILDLEYADTLKKKGQMSADDLTKYNEYLNKKHDLEVKYQSELINFIKDDSERERAIKLQEAQKYYDEKIKLAQGNYDLELRAFIEFSTAKAQIEQDYLLKTNLAYQLSLSFQESMRDIKLSEREIDQGKIKDLEAQNKEIKKQKDTLVQQLKDKKISQKDYLDQINELGQTEIENHKQINEAKKANDKSYLADMLTTTSAAFEKMGEITRQSTEKSIAERTRLLTAASDLETQMKTTEDAMVKASNEGRAEDAQSLYSKLNKLSEQRNQLQMQANDKMTEAWNSSLATVAIAWGKLAVDQKLSLKTMVLAALDALQALVPMIAAQILGWSLATYQSALTFGAAGFAQAAILTAALTAAVQLAKVGVQSMNFAKGGENIWGGVGRNLGYGLTSPGMKQIFINETTASEYIVNPYATKKLVKDLDMMNSQNISVKEHIYRNRPDIINEIRADINREIRTGTRFIRDNDMVFINSDSVNKELLKTNRELLKTNQELLETNIKMTKELTDFRRDSRWYDRETLRSSRNAVDTLETISDNTKERSYKGRI